MTSAADTSRPSPVERSRDRFERLASPPPWLLEARWDDDGGRPIAIKANIAVRGYVTSAASAALADVAPADRDAEVVARVRAAGFAVVGTANMDELAYGFTGRNDHFGTVPNPHDPSRLSGGSSSGAAALIAAGIIDAAIGTDTNGSVRLPASLCGVWGLRPTSGSVSSDGVVPLSPTLDTPGPLASNAVLLTELAAAIGLDVDDGGARARIALVSGFPAEPVTREVASAIQALASAIGTDATVAAPWAAAARAGAQVLTAGEAALAHEALLRNQYDQLGEVLRQRLVAGLAASERLIATGTRLRGHLRDRVDDIFQGNDLLLLATVPTTAPPIAATVVTTGALVERLNPALGRCTIPFSFVGLPAINVPLAVLGSGGLPIGAQLVGRPGADGLLLRVARDLEAAGVARAHIAS